MSAASEGRCRVLRISSQFLVQFFGAGKVVDYAVVGDPLPPDTQIVDARYNGFLFPGAFEVVVASDSFAPVPSGSPFPEIRPLFERLNHE